ncbi:MAG: response regulator [Deltaproteobacteria bacterium]|nr:response regulator [Deltaproteobacteria bacterium]
MRILHLEDDLKDAELIREILLLEGMACDIVRVDTQTAFVDALEGGDFQLIFCDYSLPAFDGISALKIAMEKSPDTPFIFISGKMGEDRAIETLKHGATDYILKDNLTRLVPAVNRALRELSEKMERRQADEQLKESEKKLRRLSSELLAAQEKERRRIAGELHDTVASSLSAIRFSIEKILGQKDQNEQTRGELRDLISKVQLANEETRRIMADLRPAVDDLGIVPAINWFCREYEKTYSHMHVEKQIDIAEDDLSDSLKTAIFRISQEALNNIAKHSGASLVNLRLQKGKSRIELTVRDNGQGFNLDTSRRGLGLSTMRERTELSGGSFDLESAIGEGTFVRASWPLA